VTSSAKNLTPHSLNKIKPGRRGKYNAKVVLQFIKDYFEKYDEAPTREEIAEGVGYAGPSGVAIILGRLVADGSIEMSPPRSPRNIRVLDKE